MKKTLTALTVGLGLASGVLLDHHLNRWVLHERTVCSDVRLVVLLHKRLHGFASNTVLVLLHWVGRLGVVLDWHEFGCVLHTQHLDHLTMQER